MSRLDALFLETLEGLDRKGLRRACVPVMPAAPGAVLRDGAAMVNFSSNDYLGLSRHALLAERSAEWGHRFGTGSTASRLVCGTLDLHRQVEAKLAALKGTERAMLLASGFQANATVLPALLRVAGPQVMMFADALVHSSLHHGGRAAGARPQLFRHNDLGHLAELLAGSADRPGRRFIVTESVFSMDGDRADLAGLVALADRYDAFLYVDEAHATGVLGPRGMGLCGAVPGGCDLVMGTFSKALGSFGAYVAGSAALIDFLVNACAGFIYTTALPPPMLGAIDAALDLVPGMDAQRVALHREAGRVRTEFAKLGIDTGGSTTQIIPALVGEARTALSLAAALRAQGVLAVAIRPPTVPPDTSRIRFALSAAHSPAAIDQLIAAMRASWPSLRRAA